MGFPLQQKSVILNCSVVSVVCIVTKRLRLKLRGFHYKLALNLRYLHIKLDNEIWRDPFEFQA